MSAILTTSTSSSSLKVLSDEALNILHTRGDGATLEGGTRAVSNTSYTSADSLDSEATVFIPNELESIETLYFLELNHEVANIVWAQFEARKQELPHRADILNSATRYIESFSQNPMHEQDDWMGAMSRLGMTLNFQSRLMSEDFTDMRCSASLREWILAMMEMRYRFLLTLDSVIKEPPAQTLGRRSSKLTLDGKISTKSAPPITPRISSSQAPKLGTFNVPASPSIATAVSDPPNPLPDHVMLWKGGTRERLDGLIRPDGSLSFSRLGSTPPGDFSNSVRGLYLTKHEAVAWRYAKWAAKIVDGNVVPVGLLRVAIPRELFSSSKDVVGAEWRSFVWANRHLDLIPEKFRYLDDFQWLIGPTCHSSNLQVERMEDESELQLWKLEGSSGKGSQSATQHFTGSKVTLALLDQACIGKVWITNLEGKLGT